MGASILLRNEIMISQYGQFITSRHDVFWQPNLECFPTKVTATYAYLSSRIFALPLPVRASIVDNLAPKDVKAHNFDRNVSEMEFLRLDTHRYATIITTALAILHWKAHVDANDVEFVLGSALMIPAADELDLLDPDNISLVTHRLDLYHRSVGVWILDFDCAKSLRKIRPGWSCS
ncbi:MAG: hypothetical protein Q9173_003333 [Seirophora scorigena]